MTKHQCGTCGKPLSVDSPQCPCSSYLAKLKLVQEAMTPQTLTCSHGYRLSRDCPECRQGKPFPTPEIARLNEQVRG